LAEHLASYAGVGSEMSAGVHGKCLLVFMGSVCWCSWEVSAGVHGKCLVVFMGSVCWCSWEVSAGFDRF
jgi:hypothetical protein